MGKPPLSKEREEMIAKYLLEGRYSALWCYCGTLFGYFWGIGYQWQAVAGLLVAAIPVTIAETIYEMKTHG